MSNFHDFLGVDPPEEKEEIIYEEPADDFWKLIDSISKHHYKWGELYLKHEDKWNFSANRHFSYFPDSVLYANELNQYPSIPAKWNYDYFINSLRPSKRYTEKSRKRKDDDVEAIKTYYGYNQVQSLYALSLLSTEQIKKIKKIIKGGRE